MGGKLPSIASQKRVAPLSPIMRKAPLTWCRCSGQARSTVASPGSALNRAIWSRTTDSAWLTSAVIQESSVESGFAIGVEWSVAYIKPA